MYAYRKQLAAGCEHDVAVQITNKLAVQVTEYKPFFEMVYVAQAWVDS